MKINLYLGLNDKATKKQEISTLEAYKIAERLVLASFSGCSISEQNGVYTHGNGEVVHEKSFNITVFVDKKDNRKIKNLARQLCLTFNQESVILEQVETKSEVVEIEGTK